MIIIKHREKEPHKYCKASCPCGCIFVFDEIEFINYKTPGVCSTIRCPECHTEYVKGSSNIVSISQEEYLKYEACENE